MDTKKRGTFLVVSFSCVVLLGVSAGCGGDDNDARVPPGDGNVRDGTWRITTMTEFSGSGTDCIQPSDTTVELATICNLEDEFEQGLEGLPITIDCSLELADVTYAIDCSRTTVSACTVSITLEGFGEYHDTSYDFDGTAIIRITGSPTVCPATACTLSIHEEGIWEDSIADCEDDSTAAPAVVLGGIRRLFSSY